MLVRYSSIPCFDLFHMTEEHTHILKYCEWAGEEVPCQVKTKRNHTVFSPENISHYLPLSALPLKWVLNSNKENN